MEDALVPTSTIAEYLSLSLNPCFNGRCTRTQSVCNENLQKEKKVLILVLMEDALVLQCGSRRRTSTKS